MKKTQIIALICISFLLYGCSTLTGKSSSDSAQTTELASYAEETATGKRVVKIYEEVYQDHRLIKVVIIKNGQISETVHRITSPNFSIKQQVADKIQYQPGKAEVNKGADLKIVAFTQALETAREAMGRTDYLVALDSVNKALEIDSNNPQAHMMKGSIYYAMGKLDLASQEYEIVLKLQPDNQEVKKFRDYLQSKNNRSLKTNIQTP